MFLHLVSNSLYVHRGLHCVCTISDHCIISTSLHCSHKSWWSYGSMLFMPISQPTISMSEQKPAFISHCFFLILFLAVRLGLPLLSICFGMQRVVCSEMLFSTSHLLRDVVYRQILPFSSDLIHHDSVFDLMMAANWIFSGSLHGCW